MGDSNGAFKWGNGSAQIAAIDPEPSSEKAAWLRSMAANVVVSPPLLGLLDAAEATGVPARARAAPHTHGRAPITAVAPISACVNGAWAWSMEILCHRRPALTPAHAHVPPQASRCTCPAWWPTGPHAAAGPPPRAWRT